MATARRRSSCDGWADLLATPPGYTVFPSDPLPRIPSIDVLLPSEICDEIAPDSLVPTEMCDVEDFNFQFPGELEDRSLIVSNLEPGVTATDLQEEASHFGEVESVELREGGLIGSVRFFDLRAAMAMRRGLLSRRGWILQFAPPQPIVDRKRPPNNGTIVIFHLVEGIADDQLHEKLAPFGAIRQIRAPPDRTTQRFVEFWDTRHADQALRGLRGRTILNSRISVEFSLPGGYRKNPEAFQETRAPVVVRRRVAPCTIVH
jgi:RNA recognition motif-containing protein